MSDFNAIIAEWRNAYRKTRKPINVHFRALFDNTLKPERLTHLIHPYPAKLLPHIPLLFLNAEYGRSKKGPMLIADPFSGSGTVMLEAIIAGHHFVGSETNPLARLIANVKIRRLKEEKIKKYLGAILRRFSRYRSAEPPPVVNLTKWFEPKIIADLAKLRLAIAALPNGPEKDFFLVCLSLTARKSSLADPRLSVPVRINKEKRKRYGQHQAELLAHLKSLRKTSTRTRFQDAVNRTLKRVSALPKWAEQRRSADIWNDAKTLASHVRKASVDLIITSPPYAGAQKYIRASSLSLGWLDMAYEGQLRPLEKCTIGREHFSNSEMIKREVDVPAAQSLLLRIRKQNPMRAHIAEVYLAEMAEALNAMYDILNPSGRLVLVMGANSICGEFFNTPKYIEHLACQIGFSTEFILEDRIHSRSLMTKRNKTAALIASESVICMKKRL